VFILKKIEYRLGKLFKRLVRKSFTLQINWAYWIFTLICFLSILLLGANIFRIIKRGQERYDIIQEERARLEALYEENYELKEDLKYYSSKEYVDIKAREELNLVFPDQRLVLIEEGEVPNYENDKMEEKDERKPSWKQWYDLLF
jgi:cell division protein FtsB